MTGLLDMILVLGGGGGKWFPLVPFERCTGAPHSSIEFTKHVCDVCSVSVLCSVLFCFHCFTFVVVLHGTYVVFSVFFSPWLVLLFSGRTRHRHVTLRHLHVCVNPPTAAQPTNQPIT